MSAFGDIQDHTLSSTFGHFIIANGEKQGQSSRIFSQILEPTSESGICFSFYYRFNGTSGYTLFLTLHEYNKTSRVLWSLSDSLSNPSKEWKLGQVYYKTEDSYRLFIEEYAGTDPKSYIGRKFWAVNLIFDFFGFKIKKV